MKKNYPMTHSLALLYAAISTIWRLIPHWPNVTPFTALAIYSGSQRNFWTGLIMPLLPLALTDLYAGWHATIPFVYISIILITLIGRSIKPSRPLPLFFASLASSLIFFIITNLGVWLTSGLYPHTLGGLMTTFTLAIPFYQNAIIGDLAFSLLFFGWSLITPAGHHEQAGFPTASSHNSAI